MPVQHRNNRPEYFMDGLQELRFTRIPFSDGLEYLVYVRGSTHAFSLISDKNSGSVANGGDTGAAHRRQWRVAMNSGCFSYRITSANGRFTGSRARQVRTAANQSGDESISPGRPGA
jgi:hypothetical protein